MVLMVIMGIGIGFNRNSNGPCGKLLPSIGGMLNPLNSNGIRPKNTG